MSGVDTLYLYRTYPLLGSLWSDLLRGKSVSAYDTYVVWGSLCCGLQCAGTRSGYAAYRTGTAPV